MKEKSMKLVERILVATDLGPASNDAVKTAAFVAKQFNAQVFLLHVMPADVEASETERAEMEQKLAGRLASVADSLRAGGVESVETVISTGIESETIDQTATERDVNVIIIGGGNVVDGGQFFLGTTAGRLRRKSAKPVWIVRPGAAPEIKKILCPVDFSEASARALKNAIHLARKFRGQLTVLSVIQSLASYYDEPVDLAADPKDAGAKSRLREFDKFLKKFDFEDVNWIKKMTRGKPHDEILRIARENSTDLLVMGSVGRTGVSRILIGGVARKVAQRMPCSIITVRSEDPIRLYIDAIVAKADANRCASKPPGARCSRLEHGKELLEQGFPEEAMSHFQECIGEYDLCPNAWANLASAYKRLGNEEEAQKCEERAEQLEKILSSSQIEHDIRENHVLFRSIFGI
jgi:nucleotide-binding universal stress UspA family protein